MTVGDGSPDDDASTSRRTALGLVVAGGVGGLFYFREALGAGLESAVRSFESRTNPEWENLGVTDRRWDGGTFVLEFAANDDIDGWSISHEGRDVAEDPLFIGATPEGGGTIELPFEQAIDESDKNFPTSTFEFAVFSGVFPAWDEDGEPEIDEYFDSLPFQAPPEFVERQ